MKHKITLALTALLCTFGAIRAQVPFTQEGDYYLISSAEDIVKLSELSNDGATIADVQNAKFKLTQDIDLAGVENFTPIFYTSSNGSSFKGYFDGRGHTISNVTITTNETNQNHLGFFGLVNGGEVRNLCLKNLTINNNSMNAVARGGLAGRNGSGVVENCCVVNFTFNDKSITETGTSSVGAVVGYLSSAEATIVRYCYAYNASRIVDGEPILLATYGKKGAKATKVTPNFDETKYDSDQFTSGEICYLLNNSQSDNPIWFQTLGEDNSPVLDNTHKVIYLANDLTCDGKPKGENIYGNNGVGERDAHNFVDGICSVCNNADPTWVEAIDGVYQIGTAKQLQWFAALVNSGVMDVKAELTADIDLGEVENFTPIGMYSDGAFGGTARTNTYFRGTFDGKGHVIRNVTVSLEEDYEVGLFGRITNSTIQNLCIEGITVTNLSGNARTGGLAGLTNNGTVKNVYVMDATVTAAVEGNTGGLVGENVGATITNCFTNHENAIGKNTSGTLTRVYGGQDIMGRVETGELTWMLNAESFVSPTWFQNIGEDPHPTLDATHKIVYLRGEDYANVDESNFSDFRSYLTTQESDFCDEAVATQSLIDTYKAEINTWSEIATLEEFIEKYAQAKSMHDAITKSAKAYQTYIAAVQDARAQLAEMEEQNNYRYLLEDYLDEGNEIAPGDYPNGNSTYILTTHTLTEEELTAEMAYLEKMILRVKLSNPEPGSDVTFIMNNPDFVSSFTGWTNEGKAEMAHGGVTEIMHVVRGMSGPFSTYQSLTDLPNGIYELRMNAFTRTGNDVYSKLYTSFLFMNDVANHIMAVGEDPVWEEDVVDGVNCHITGSSLDVTYLDEESGATGYVPSYLVGCSYAYNVDRYVNRVAVEVTDGKLTLGVRDLASSLGNWTPFTKARLYYLGTAEEANDSLALVLGDFVARATVIRDFVADNGSEYTKFPNISNELREQIATAIAESENAATGEQKMALIKRMSDLFTQVYSCRMAYIEMLKSTEKLEDLATKLLTAGILSNDEYSSVYAATSEAWDAFEKGTVNEEGAQALVRKLEEYYGSIALPVDENGFYHLSTPRHMVIFTTLVNGGEHYANAMLDEDIDMSSVENFTPLGYTDANAGAYRGIFDGKGHTISHLTITAESDNVNHLGFVGLLLNGTLRNLCLKDMTINNNSTKAVARGALVGRLSSGPIENCSVVNFTFNDMPIVEISTTAVGALVGYLASVETTVMRNSFAYNANLVLNGETSALPAYGNKGGKATAKNNYDSRRTSVEQYASGEIAYLLNDEQSDIPVWYQTLGEDAYPVLTSTSKVVYKLEDGTYTNVKPSGETEVPVADVLDVVFHEDGTAEDVSPLHNTVELIGETTSTYYNETYGRYAARFDNPWGKTCTGYYKVDYEENEAVRSALADGHTLEMLVMGNYEGTLEDVEAKPFSAMQGGGTGFLICKTTTDGRQNEFTFLPNVTETGSSTWRWVNSSTVPEPQKFYHVVGVWNKEQATASIYVNGVLCKTVDAPGDFKFASAGCNWFCLGGDPANASSANASWKGDLVIARAYDKPLVSAEVIALWKKLNEGSSIADIRDSKTTGGYIYDLSGRRVEKPVKGLYIIDGRKVFVK